jgi:dihydrofolate synthase/folylpolyglutamate synthase
MTTLADVNEALRPYDAVTKQTMGKHITLTRSEKLMAHLGNPEQKLRVVHIAGTSGKTSTTYYIAALLTAAGCKAGSTVSPYVDAMNERIQINGQPIPEKQFAEYFTEFIELVQTAPETPTRFEVLIAFAYWVFAKEKVDYAVIETGMGGLDDSTNVAARADKVCVLTDIGYDHMEHLGNTLGKIAHQKAGIIHEGNIALMYTQAPEIMQVVRYWVSQQEDAELLTFEQDRLATAYGDKFPGTMPAYQKRNWLLAFAAYKYLAKRDDLPNITATQLQKTQGLQVPGRMDARKVGEKTIIMDGAHNGQKMTAFWQSFTELYKGVKPTVLFALKQGKEIADIAPLLAQHASEVIVTTFSKTQDLPIASMEPSEITSVLQANGVKYRVCADQGEAYAVFCEVTKEVGVITGSFFLIAQLREGHKELR